MRQLAAALRRTFDNRAGKPAHSIWTGIIDPPTGSCVPGVCHMVTAGTLHKVHVFRGDERLQVLQDMLLQTMSAVGLELHAWAVFSNHYHVIVQVPENVEALRSAVRRLHSTTAREINVRDNTPGRQVWFQYWDTCLTYENSYFARLNYVHHNAVHHRLVPTATAYPYCSAASFERRAEPGFRRKVQSCRFDRVRVIDDS